MGHWRLTGLQKFLGQEMKWREGTEALGTGGVRGEPGLTSTGRGTGERGVKGEPLEGRGLDGTLKGQRCL